MSNQDGPSEEWLARCRKRMERIYAMSPAFRGCVDEHGLTIVDAFTQSGVRIVDHINEMVRAIREGRASEKLFVSFGITKVAHMRHLRETVLRDSNQGWSRTPADSGPLGSGRGWRALESRRIPAAEADTRSNGEGK